VRRSGRIGRRRRIFAVLWLFAAAAAAHAETLPAKGSVDSRIRIARYDADDVYRLVGFVGYQIDLEFEPGESFVGLGAGDIEGIGFVGQDNHLFLKPKAAKVATNLTVLTSRRHYHFDYTASAARPAADAAEVIYALRFVYPGAPRAAAARDIDAAFAASAAVVLNLDYWYCGHPSLRPIRASDDGVQTRLRFDAHAELPAVFVRNDDGSESLLNFSMDGADLVVHRVAHRFALRRGGLTGCIVNRGFNGGGARLESGTVSPGVRRATPDAP
jgi:type IV secretion system protein VirB9